MSSTIARNLTWQKQAIEELSGVVDNPDLLTLDADGNVHYPEDYEEPGWLAWLDGQRLRMNWGSVTFECDVVDRSFTATAERLLTAAEAWNE